jgi:hypothetical protein
VARFKYTVSARADGDHLIVRAAETSRMAINQILVEEGLPEISSLDDEDA